MGINESLCTQCENAKEEQNFNMDDNKDNYPNPPVHIIDVPNYVKNIKPSGSLISNNNGQSNIFAKHNIITPLNNNNSYLYKSMSNSYSKQSGIIRNKIRSMSPKEDKAILIQSVYRGKRFRNIFPNIRPSLAALLDKKIECLKIRFDHQNPTKTEEIKGKFDPKGWKAYYSPFKSSFFEYNEEKNGKLYPCPLLTYKDISYYIGTVNILYQRSGQGTLVDISGCKSEGMWVADKLNGWCRVVDSEGNLSEGLYINNVLKGKGERYYADGTIYKGDFSDGVRHGEGTEETPEHTFTGIYVNDRKHGIGKLQYKSKEDLYIGEFTNNSITGNGKYIWQNKDVYEGSFLNGKMHGKGKYVWADGDEYEGDYVDGLKEGIGVFKWSNGKIYSGTFSGGKPNGKGIFYSDDKKYDVVFIDGRMTETRQIN